MGVHAVLGIDAPLGCRFPILHERPRTAVVGMANLRISACSRETERCTSFPPFMCPTLGAHSDRAHTATSLVCRKFSCAAGAPHARALGVMLRSIIVEREPIYPSMRQ